MMASALDDVDFCFPPLGREVSKVDKAAGAGGGSGFCRSQQDMRLQLPKQEFPYEFRLTSEVEFPVGKTASDEDDFFAELTQRLTLSESKNVSSLNLLRPLQTLKVSAGSPQSILGEIGSWSGRSSNGSPQQEPSPPATPFEAKMDPRGFGYDARLKPSVEDPMRAALYSKPESNHHLAHFQNVEARYYAELGMKQTYLAAARKARTAALVYERHLLELKRSVMYSKSGVNSQKPNQLIGQQQQQKGSVPVQPNFQGVQLQRKESNGTGVFIPRRYLTTPALRKQNTVTSPVLVPAKVVHALNKSFEELNGRSQLHCSPYAASLNQQTYDALLARRRDVLAQQHIAMDRADDLAQKNLEACLPQEWSY